MRPILHAGGRACAVRAAAHLVVFVGVVGCGDRITSPTPTPDPGPDVDALFAPPTVGEIAEVEVEWAARHIAASDVRLELDSVVTAGDLATRVRILSHLVGGPRHYGALVTPIGAAIESLPVVVYAHLGDEGTSVEEILLVSTAFQSVQQPVALVAPSFRDEPLRFGEHVFLSDGPASPWDRDVDDAIALLSVSLEEAPELDIERVVVVGLSRGGGVGLLMAIRDPRIDAVVDFFGPTDLFDEYGREIFDEALRGELRDLPGLEHLNATIIQPWDSGALSTLEARLEMLRRSAVYFAGRLPAVQVHHGTADTIVAVSQTERLIEAMEAEGRTAADFEAHIYPDGDHNPFNLPGAVDRTVEFLSPYLSDLPVPLLSTRGVGRSVH